VPVEGDRSDHFGPAALGIKVTVRRHDDGTYISVENASTEPGHGPLLVEVDHSGAITYCDDDRDE
jgi:hypothetical protein